MTADNHKLEPCRIWFDTEFIEDGKTIDLISIGMVREDGATYYAECAEADLTRADDWVRDNVIADLTGETTPRAVIAREIIDFAGPSPEFWAYYADYDWVALCQLFGRMTDLPNGWPMFCRDLKQWAVELGSPTLPKQSGMEHHALADALWNKEVWGFLNRRTPPVPASVEEIVERLRRLASEMERHLGPPEMAPGPDAEDLREAADRIASLARENEELRGRK